MLTVERLRTLFDIDLERGLLFWKWRPDIRPSSAARLTGKLAGTKRSCDGYCRINIDHKLYLRHRLIWLLAYGHLPICDIDHKNRDPGNDGVANLRLATRAQNIMNTSAVSRHGVRGAHFQKQSGRWRSQIKVDGKTISLGYFEDKYAAANAYAAAARTHFGEFAPK